MSAPATPAQPCWDDELRQAERTTLHRLSKLVEAEDPKVALRACEAVVKAVANARRAASRPEPKPPAAPAEPPPRPAPVAVNPAPRRPQATSAPKHPAAPPAPTASTRRAAAVLTSVLRPRPPGGS